MTLPVTIPNTFANATSSIPLSQLDANFSTLSNVINQINAGTQTVANLTSSNVTITGGTIANVTLDNVTVDVETLSNVTINGGNVTVTNMVATTANATTGNITTVNATTIDTTSIEVTNIKAKDGTAALSIADSTGVTTQSTPAVISVNSSSDALRITQTGAGNALVVEDSTNPDSTPFVIDSIGKVVVGNTVQYGGAALQSIVTDSTLALGLQAWRSASAGGTALAFFKSRSGTVGTLSSVASGDTLGILRWSGDDGSSGFVTGAEIVAAVDGTPGTNDMPGRLVFSTTADGASSPTERMRIDNAGRVGIGGTPSAAQSLAISKQVSGGTTGYQIVINGQVQSGVVNTNGVAVFNALSSTAAITNLATFSANQGTFAAGYTATNQFGYYADSSLTGATNNYGFYSNIASGTGRWNFYANGTANNYFGGNIGINDSSSNLDNNNLVVNRNLTGATAARAVWTIGTVQSDVTAAARYFATNTATANASFTLGELTHYHASQGTFGASSTVTNQYGFVVASNLTGATNNYGFYGNIAAGSNRWNLYMAGTAANYFGGDVQFKKAIIEEVYTITDGAAFEIDPSNGTIQLITLGASRTPKATNFAAGESITLMVNDGSAYTITWTNATWGGSGVVWLTNSGTAPTLATTGYTTIVLWKVGSQVYGARVGDNA